MAPLSAPVAMYATTRPNVEGLALDYTLLALQPPARALMYLTPELLAMGPSRIFNPMAELLDGGSWDFGGNLQSLVGVSLSGVTIDDVFNALPEVIKA